MTPCLAFGILSHVMDEITLKNMLYDFYGELLTEHQRKIYEDAVFGDYSLSELSEEYGVTRQGIHDLLKRCDKILKGYEDKLHLVEKFQSIRNDAECIIKACEEADASTLIDNKELIIHRARHIIKEL